MKGGFHCSKGKEWHRQQQPCARRYAKPDVGADSALSIIYTLGMLPMQLNVKHHGQEAAQSGSVWIVGFVQSSWPVTWKNSKKNAGQIGSNYFCYSWKITEEITKSINFHLESALHSVFLTIQREKSVPFSQLKKLKESSSPSKTSLSHLPFTNVPHRKMISSVGIDKGKMTKCYLPIILSPTTHGWKSPDKVTHLLHWT